MTSPFDLGNVCYGVLFSMPGRQPRKGSVARCVRWPRAASGAYVPARREWPSAGVTFQFMEAFLTYVVAARECFSNGRLSAQILNKFFVCLTDLNSLIYVIGVTYVSALTSVTDPTYMIV